MKNKEESFFCSRRRWWKRKTSFIFLVSGRSRVFEFIEKISQVENTVVDIRWKQRSGCYVDVVEWLERVKMSWAGESEFWVSDWLTLLLIMKESAKPIIQGLEYLFIYL